MNLAHWNLGQQNAERHTSIPQLDLIEREILRKQKNQRKRYGQGSSDEFDPEEHLPAYTKYFLAKLHKDYSNYQSRARNISVQPSHSQHVLNTAKPSADYGNMASN